MLDDESVRVPPRLTSARDRRALTDSPIAQEPTLKVSLGCLPEYVLKLPWESYFFLYLFLCTRAGCFLRSRLPVPRCEQFGPKVLFASRAGGGRAVLSSLRRPKGAGLFDPAADGGRRRARRPVVIRFPSLRASALRPGRGGLSRWMAVPGCWPEGEKRALMRPGGQPP